MTDKEILAEYKIAYENFTDIYDNAIPEQVTEEEREKIQEMMKILENLYYDLYERIKSAEDISLYYQENIRIAPYINMDYINEENEYIQAGDLNWQKWWEDYSFLTEF